MTLGRPREFDRDAALDAGMRLFWRKGYNDSSLEDLLEAMRISRGSFYSAFHSKEEVFREALRRYSDLMAGELGRKLLKAPTARAFVEEVMDIPVCEARDKTANGCLIINTASEFGQRHAEFSEDARQAMDVFNRLFAQAILRAQHEGSVPRSADPATLGVYLSASLGSLRTLAKAGASPETLQSVVPIFLKALE